MSGRAPSKDVSIQRAWKVGDLARETWLRSFASHEIAEIERAVHGLRETKITDLSFDKELFPLPTFGPSLRDILGELETGCGVVLLRGFPVERFSPIELRQISWGIGLHLGTARVQDQHGTLLGDVRDMGEKRGHANSGHLNFHTDPTDVTTLFCLNVAREGGTSLFASSIAIRDEIARTRPDLLRLLYEPMIWSWAGRQWPGEKSWCEIPIFGAGEDGQFASMYYRMRFVLESSEGRAPPLRDDQMAALDLIETLLRDPAFTVQFEFAPGDLQIVNNYVIYHGRTGFSDDPAQGRIRHLLRLWLSVPTSRALPPAYGVILKDHRAGHLRGGYAVPRGPAGSQN
ncbi:MAG: TauD/TfdA family dioxygenase [Rhodospirillales bacterium]|nr:TauD/TfdA family dioxygenase [Rhodospirillales bacterium]